MEAFNLFLLRFSTCKCLVANHWTIKRSKSLNQIFFGTKNSGTLCALSVSDAVFNTYTSSYVRRENNRKDAADAWIDQRRPDFTWMIRRPDWMTDLTFLMRDERLTNIQSYLTLFNLKRNVFIYPLPGPQFRFLKAVSIRTSRKAPSGQSTLTNFLCLTCTGKAGRVSSLCRCISETPTLHALSNSSLLTYPERN